MPADDHYPDALHELSDEFAVLGDSAAYSEVPPPVDWSSLTAIERRTELQRLRVWVLELAGKWALPRDVVPPCWYRHESHIRILSASRDAYLSAYHPSQPASAAADWMHVMDATEERLRLRVSRTGCKSADHRPDRIQRWVVNAKEARSARRDFDAFLVADFHQRAAEELNTAIGDNGDGSDA